MIKNERWIYIQGKNNKNSEKVNKKNLKKRKILKQAIFETFIVVKIWKETNNWRKTEEIIGTSQLKQLKILHYGKVVRAAEKTTPYSSANDVFQLRSKLQTKLAQNISPIGLSSLKHLYFPALNHNFSKIELTKRQ